MNFVVTTEVQNVSICLVNAATNTYSSTISIQCVYLRGSAASGCIYTLVGGEGAENITGSIERDIAGFVMADISHYREVLAYANTNDGTLPIRARLEYIEPCPSTTGT